MVRSREMAWRAATAGVVTLTLMVVPAWSPLHAGGQRDPGANESVDVQHSGSRCTDIGSTSGAPDASIDERTAARQPSGQRAQQVLVGVPRTAMIRLDSSGRVVAAWTNTGCAPRPTDEVWLRGADGSITAAGSTEIADREWQGDFSRPGVFVLQRRERISNDGS